MKNPLKNAIEYMNVLKADELKKLISEIPIGKILKDWDTLTKDESLKIFLSLDLESKVDLLNSLPISDQERLVETLSVENTKLIFGEMEPDDLTDFIQSVSPEIRKSVWENLTQEAKKDALFLLRFDEDDAAGLMTPRYLAIRKGLSIKQALTFIRENAKEVETVYYIYIVDELQRLIGVISLREILTAPDDDPITKYMEDNLIKVHEETDQEEVAKTLETYDLLAVPVTDNMNKLLGIVTFDDVIDVIREEQTEDVYKMGAMGGDIEPYMDSSIWTLVKKRLPWLILLLLVGTITSNVLHHYQSLVLGASFLLIFLPVITQTGGNSGSQSTTLMIRGLATGEVHFKDFGKVLLKELFVGLIIGIITGIVIILRSVFMPPGIDLFQAIIIGLSINFVVLFSSLIGAAAPLLINKMGFDPTVMSAPLMATVIDVIGLTIYFEIAKIFLKL